MTKDKLVDQLAGAIEAMQEVYKRGTEKDFMQLFTHLGFGEPVQLMKVIDLMRWYDPRSKRRRVPHSLQAQHFFDKAEEPFKRYVALQRIIENFKHGQKGAEGGLKEFSEDLLEMKRANENRLGDYKTLREKKRDGTEMSANEARSLEEYEEFIPVEIKGKIWSRGIKGLATDWLAMELPCTRSTLVQIISGRPKRTQ